jgi:hypothetical protein
MEHLDLRDIRISIGALRKEQLLVHLNGSGKRLRHPKATPTTSFLHGRPYIRGMEYSLRELN